MFILFRKRFSIVLLFSGKVVLECEWLKRLIMFDPIILLSII